MNALLVVVAIVGGVPAPGEVAVVGLARRAPTCGEAPIVIDCSATVVAPRVVVTAAHCLGDDPPNIYQVFFGASAEEGGIAIAVTGGRAHPEFDRDTFANDIAALILAEDAPVAPLPMRTTPLPDLTGTLVTIAGYGLTAIDAQDTGVRRSGTARVTAVGATELDTAPDPALACTGDSGGPVIAGGELIAVSTHGDAACAQYGKALRVDVQQPFLVEVLAEAAAAEPRRAFDPDEDLCALTCDGDADCPADTVCFGARCVLAGLPPGQFRDACPGDDALCVTIPGGSCRRYVDCDSIPREDDGCCSGGGGQPAVWLVAFAWLLRRRGARR